MSDASVNIENAEIVPRSDYVEALRRIQEEGSCPFCEAHLPRYHPKPILWKSDHWIVTTNAWPYEGTRLHFLLITRLHVERIEDLPAPARISVFDEFEKLAREYGFAGASLLWRSGDTKLTGASVRHLHAQIIVGQERAEDSEAITGLLGFRDA